MRPLLATDSGQSQPPQSGQIQTLQESRTSGTQGKEKGKVRKPGPSIGEPAPLEGKGPSQGPSSTRGHLGALLRAGK